jgi:phosphoadenosine phosphosulfate reductase
MSVNNSNVLQIADDYSAKKPTDILRLALNSFDKIAISFSGAEDVVLVDMACNINPDVQIFCLDTGRLHPETYRFIEKVREFYELDIEILFPQQAPIEQLIKSKGLYSFYKDGHKECCGLRKVEPLRRKLSSLDAWVTGQRKDQSPGTRAEIAIVEHDIAFSLINKPLFKFNPLANWSSAQVWEYIRINEIPYNDLHERGFISIGCEPCTRAVLPNQHEREGRWWWEQETMKECGLHTSQNKTM